MSVTDEIQLGELRLTPKNFSGTDVELELNIGVTVPVGDSAPGEQTTVRQALMDPNGGQSMPRMPIAVWESLQDCATKLAAYETLIATGAAS